MDMRITGIPDKGSEQWRAPDFPVSADNSFKDLPGMFCE
jgi:hypothetical protein